jgi:GNAT superfamily N-acetyltransferase
MINIKALDDIYLDYIIKAFADAGWPKPCLKNYHQEKDRFVWIAFIDDVIAGYVTLKLNSQYKPFAKNNIPEISDLNVLPKFRKQGIGTKLICAAESKAFEISDTVGIGVGLYGGADLGYGPAQKLYIELGYIPDGLGVTYNYKQCIPGESYQLDDDLILWMQKKIGWIQQMNLLFIHTENFSL